MRQGPHGPRLVQVTGRRSKPESQVMVSLGEWFQFHLKHIGAQIREADSLNPFNAVGLLRD